MQQLIRVCAVVIGMGAAAPAAAQALHELPEGIETRWASPENPTGARGAGGSANAGRKGAAFFALEAGKQRTLAEVTNTSGTVRRIWMTLRDRSPKMLRGMRLDMYWDGAKTPAVSAPLGDFFGVGLGRVVPFQSALFSSPEGRSFNASVPMPFRSAMRIVLTNETDQPQPQVYYDVDYTIGDRHPPSTLYFHAHFRRENPTTMQRDFEILPRLTGAGRYLGVNVGVIVNGERYGRTWWGEGEVKIYLDGDRELPTLAGTGAEDYIGAGYELGAFAHQFQGATIADHQSQRYAFYRYHVNDPVYFRKDIRVTIQQIGFLWSNDGSPEKPVKAPLYAAGEGLRALDLERLPNANLFERVDDYSSCAYFYLAGAENGLPVLTPVAERIKGL
jgi:hypothetical protein